MFTPKRLETVTDELALDNGLLQKVLEDEEITPDEIPTLIEVRDNLRQQLADLEGIIVWQMTALFMFNHAAPPNKHIRRRARQVEELQRKAAQTEHSSQAA